MHTWGRNHTVEKYLDKEERSCVGAYVFGIVDEIASHCHAGVVRLLFSVQTEQTNLMYVTSLK